MQKHINIYDLIESKAMEYTKFDPMRARNLYKKLEPHIKLSTFNIHIIGTNGKGSTGRFITQSLYQSGYKVLHFTSPHIFDFIERFYINDDIVKMETLESAHRFLQGFSFMQEASYFEYATFLALVMARECDFLVMESGVGGEYDSTSILKYQMTIFTKIGIDHKDLLGDSLQDIAMTKLRASQGEIFTHFQEPAILDMFKRLQEIVSSGAMSDLSQNIIGDIHYLNNDDINKVANRNSLPHFLIENLALANKAIEYINTHVKSATLTTKKLDLRGRCERISPNIMIDVGHNEMAAKAVLNEMLDFSNNEKFILIYNSYKGKEAEKILKIFKGKVEKIIIFEVENYRILEKEIMIKIIENLDISYDFLSIEDQKRAIFEKNSIKSRANFLQTTKKYLIFGSFSLVENFLLLYKAMH